MSPTQRHNTTNKFLLDFRKLVHRYAGKSYPAADTELLYMMQEKTSVFNPYIWPKEKEKVK